MKKTKKPKKLFFTLSVYIALFSIAYIVLFIVGGDYALTSISNRYWNNSTTNKNVDNYLESGQFNKLPKNDVFGKNGYFDIVDDNYITIYSSNEQHNYTKEEIDAMLDSPSRFYDLINLKGGLKLLIKYSDNQENLFYLIDKDYTIIDTNSSINSEKLSDKQLSIFFDEQRRDNFTYKHEFNYEGKTYTLVGYEVKMNETYETFLAEKRMLFILFSIVFIIGVFILVYLLNRLINEPLEKLKVAIDDYGKYREKPMMVDNGPAEIVDIAAQFNIMTSSIDEMEKQKAEFQQDRQLMLANISHDLKTPITIIQGYSKAIVDKVITDDNIIKKSQVIYDKSCYLNELINNFSEFSTLEHPGFTYDFKELNLTELVRNFFVLKYDEIQSRDIELEILTESEVMANIDAYQFTRVLENIVNNAMKYNPKGITIRVVIDEEKLMISNSGVFIDDAIAETIFKPFSMGDEARSKGGTGLGLSIVKKIVDDHHFTIQLITNNNDFLVTTFVINLKKS